MHVKRQQYSTAQETGNRSAGGAEIGIIRLRDEAHGVEAAVMPSYGNAAVEMKVHGKEILHFSTRWPGHPRPRTLVSVAHESRKHQSGRQRLADTWIDVEAGVGGGVDIFG